MNFEKKDLNSSKVDLTKSPEHYRESEYHLLSAVKKSYNTVKHDFKFAKVVSGFNFAS
jgi:hypothetical protein